MRLKPFDFLAFAIALGVMIGFSTYALSGRGEPSEVYVDADEERFIYPLSEDREIDVEGPLGKTHIVIKNERVHVDASPCRDKICIAMGHAQFTGDWIACLPNRVFVRVRGDEEDRRVDGQTF